MLPQRRCGGGHEGRTCDVAGLATLALVSLDGSFAQHAGSSTTRVESTYAASLICGLDYFRHNAAHLHTPQRNDAAAQLERRVEREAEHHHEAEGPWPEAAQEELKEVSAAEALGRGEYVSRDEAGPLEHQHPCRVLAVGKAHVVHRWDARHYLVEGDELLDDGLHAHGHPRRTHARHEVSEYAVLDPAMASCHKEDHGQNQRRRHDAEDHPPGKSAHAACFYMVTLAAGSLAIEEAHLQAVLSTRAGG